MERLRPGFNTAKGVAPLRQGESGRSVPGYQVSIPLKGWPLCGQGKTDRMGPRSESFNTASKDEFQYRERVGPFAADQGPPQGTLPEPAFSSFNTAKGLAPLRHASGSMAATCLTEFQYRERVDPFAAQKNTTYGLWFNPFQYRESG